MSNQHSKKDIRIRSRNIKRTSKDREHKYDHKSEQQPQQHKLDQVNWNAMSRNETRTIARIDICCCMLLPFASEIPRRTHVCCIDTYIKYINTCLTIQSLQIDQCFDPICMNLRGSSSFSHLDALFQWGVLQGKQPSDWSNRRESDALAPSAGVGWP